MRNIGDVVARPADEKCKVAKHPMPGAANLVGKRIRARRQRLRIRHLENGGHAARDGGAAARFQIFLVLEARLAEMHLCVDDARQDVQAPGIDRLGGLGRTEIADRGDPPAP